jgi:HYR domain
MRTSTNWIRSLAILVVMMCGVAATARSARADVRIVSVTATPTDGGSASATQGTLQCVRGGSNGPREFSSGESCVTGVAQCTVRNSAAFVVIREPATPDPRDLHNLRSFGLETGAQALVNPCDGAATNLSSSASITFAITFFTDSPVVVKVSGQTRFGASLSVDLPGVTIPGDGRFAMTVVAQPGNFTVSGTLSHSTTDPGQLIGGENANFGFEFEPLPRRPVLIIPGVGATYSADVSDDHPWLIHRGIAPSFLQIDPMTRVYDDLFETLKSAGYVEGKDLFKVLYDWRLPPGPDDHVLDGTIAGLTAASISSGHYTYAVDYLGEILKQASAQWTADHPALPPLDAVDVIAHSTGGLVARTYIQSGAYGGLYGQTSTLPRINNMIMIGVPNQGASKAWNPMHDNWSVDKAFQVVLSKIINRAYQKVVNKGVVISGPDYDISLASISHPQCQDSPEVCFVNQYVPTARALLATYDFIDFGAGLTNVNLNQGLRNSLLLDLNHGDPNAFADPAKVMARPSIIYGTNGAETPTTVVQDVGPTFTPPGFSHPIAKFVDNIGRDAGSNEIYYRDVTVANGGDGTVPLVSSAQQFLNDPRVTLLPFTKGSNTASDVAHTALPYNPDVQQTILDILGVSCPAPGCTISTNQHSLGLNGATQCAVGCSNFGLDPVEGFLIDAQGRRLGFSAATGPLSEIPGSVWFGNAEGMGWIFGPVEEPVTVELSGLGQDYYVDATVLSPAGAAGVIDRGVLALGAGKVLPLPLAGSTTIADTIPPVSAAAPSTLPNPAAWNNSDVVVTLSASDNASGSGVKAITYGATGAQPLVSTTVTGASVAIGVASEGQTLVTYFATDNSGNTEPPKTITINLDKTAPAIAVPPNLTVPQTSTAGATVSYPAPAISDGGSGIDSSSCVPASGSQFSVGSTPVRCSATDRAGNVGTGTFVVTVTPDGRIFGAGHAGASPLHHHFVFRVSQRQSKEHARLEYWVNEPKVCRSDDDDEHGRDFDGDHDDNYGRDHRRAANRFEAATVNDVTFSDDPAFQPGRGRQPTVDSVRFTGTGQWNGRSGYTFEAFATDQGEPGRHRDTFSLVIRDARGTIVASVNGDLDGGNIQSTRVRR